VTTGRTGYGRATDIDPLAARMEALEAGLTTALGYSHFINAKRYDTIQHAIDAAPAYNGTLVDAGAIVFVPAGYYKTSSVPAMGQLTIPDGVTLMGEGSLSTVLHYDGGVNNNIVTVTGNHSALVGLEIRGPNAAGTGKGVLFGVAGSGLRHFRMDDVFVDQTGSWALHAQETSIESMFRHCRFVGGKSNGHILVDSACTTMRFIGCESLNPTGYHVKLSNVTNINFFGCNFENSTATDPSQPFIYQTSTWATGFHGCYWEDAATTPTKFFLWNEGRVLGSHWEGCFFTRDNGAVLRLIKCNGSAGSASRQSVLRSPYCWLGTTPSTGTDDIVTVHAQDQVYVNHPSFFDTDTVTEVAALTTTGPGTMSVTNP